MYYYDDTYDSWDDLSAEDDQRVMKRVRGLREEVAAMQDQMADFRRWMKKDMRRLTAELVDAGRRARRSRSAGEVRRVEEEKRREVDEQPSLAKLREETKREVDRVRNELTDPNAEANLADLLNTINTL